MTVVLSRALRRFLRDVPGMPTTTPMPTKNPGDVLTSALWNSYLRDNIDKLLTRGHRVLTVAQFAALTGLEGTKGTVAPDEVYLEVDATNGVQWHLAYESGEATYKWRFLGGPPLTSEVLTGEGSTSTTPADLATVGPQVVSPRGGDYFLQSSVIAANTNVGGRSSSFLGSPTDQVVVGSVSFNGTGVSGGYSIEAGVGGQRRINAVAASVNLKVQYSVTAGSNGTWSSRRISVRPVRLI